MESLSGGLEEVLLGCLHLGHLDISLAPYLLVYTLSPLVIHGSEAEQVVVHNITIAFKWAIIHDQSGRTASELPIHAILP